MLENDTTGLSCPLEGCHPQRRAGRQQDIIEVHRNIGLNMFAATADARRSPSQRVFNHGYSRMLRALRSDRRVPLQHLYLRLCLVWFAESSRGCSRGGGIDRAVTGDIVGAGYGEVGPVQ